MGLKPMFYLHVFILLQLMDYFTTLIGLRLGASEASPFVRCLMTFGPAAGVGLSKLLALALAGICIWRRKVYLVKWVNCWYVALVVWNVGVILTVHP